MLCSQLLISPLFNHLIPSFPFSLSFPFPCSALTMSLISSHYHAGVQSTKNQFYRRVALRHLEPLRCFTMRFRLTLLFQTYLDLKPCRSAVLTDSCGVKWDTAGVWPLLNDQFRVSSHTSHSYTLTKRKQLDSERDRDSEWEMSYGTWEGSWSEFHWNGHSHYQ